MPRASRTWLCCVFFLLFCLPATEFHAAGLTGSISGRVTAAGSGDPIPGVTISIYNDSGGAAAHVVTGADGRYVAAGLEPGTYHAVTNNPDGFVNVAYGGAPCLGCQPTSGLPIVVTDATETADINFALSRGGRFSGRVVAAGSGAPLQGVPILVSDATGAGAFAAVTDADGRYTSGAGLPSGTYGVRTMNAAGYIDKRHPDTSCAGTCFTPLPPSVMVTAPDTTPDINFALDESAAIAGTIVDETTSQPLAGIRVAVLDAGGMVAYSSGITNASGVYRVDTNIPSGNVLVQTQESGYIDEVYDNLACSAQCRDQYPMASRIAVTQGGTTGNIDFALRRGATLSGTVTSGGQPAAGVYVVLGGPPPSTSFSAVTDAVGRYTITGISAGAYHLFTSTSDYLDKAWPNVTCPTYCGMSDGDLVIVADGDARGGYDFDLVKGGTIQGTVTGPVTGWINVTARGTTNLSFGAGMMIEMGNSYTIRKLPPDTYKVFVSSAGDYIGEVYDNVQCIGDCWSQSNTSGTPIGVGAGQAVTGINFALDKGGSISGTVTDSATNEPLTGVNVFAQGTSYSRSATTDAAGSFTITGLAPDQYGVFTYNDLGYLDEVYPDIPCTAACAPSSGTRVQVGAGAAVSGISLALTRGATISGTVTSNGVPLAGVSVGLYTAGPAPGLPGAATDAAGRYTIRKIPAGSYYLRTWSADHIDETYPNVQCLPWCSGTDGYPVAVGAGENKGGYDFDLARGARITGNITSGGAPVTTPMGATARHAMTGQTFYSQMDPMSGSGYSIRKLPAGTYKVYVPSSNGYVGEIYDDIACPTSNCNADAATLGTPVALGEGEARGNVNFDLSMGGTLSGRVTGNGVPLANVNVQLQQLNGTAGAWAMTGIDGRYTLRGVVPGSYSLRTTGSFGYVDELWSDVPCSPGCSLNIGTPIDIAGTPNLDGYDFDLAPAAIVRGTVTGPSGGAPAVFVTLYKAPSTYYSVSVSANGGYEFRAVIPGSYIAYTSNNQGFIDEVYDNLPCIGSCSSTAGATPIVLAAGDTRTVNFALALGGKVSGTVRGDGALVSGIMVQVSGPKNAGATTDAQGRFEIAGLPDGTYKAYTTGSSTFVGEVYANHQCPLTYCDTSAGDPIVITGGSTASAIDFDLARGAVVSGTVTAAGGGAIQGATVSVHDRDGFQMRSATTGANGSYVVGGLAAGTVYVRVAAANYVDQLYSGIDCVGSCRVIAGTPIVLGEAQQAQAHFTLNPAARITGRVRSAVTQAGIAQVNVTATRADGSFAGSVSTTSTGDYTVNGLPTGTYYLRTSGPHGYINQMYGGVPCPFSCSPTSGTAIDVTAGQAVSGKDFDLQPGLRIRGRVVDEATGLPISASVSVMTATNYTAGSANTAADGTYQSVGLPPGTYYVRAQSSAGYVPEVYGGTVCFGSCSGVGTPVAIAASDVANIDFALAKGGSISGTITDATTHNGVMSVNVTIVDAAGTPLTSALTGPGGTFKTTTGLSSGTYYVRAGSSSGSYVTRWYGGPECVGSCTNFSGATPVAVTLPAETPGVSIELRRGGAIAGRMVDSAGDPVTSGSAIVYTTSGAFAVSAPLDSTGGYKTPSSLPEGDYYVTGGSARMVREVYGSGAQCLFNCPLSSGTPVHVMVDSVTGGIDFTLSPGGTIAGRVLSALSSQPVPYVQVFLLDGEGRRLTKANGTVDGLFQMGAAVPPGSYYLLTSAEGYVPALHDGQQCLANCNPPAIAQPIVIAGSEVVNVEIAIQQGGRISGTLLSSGGTPIPGGVQVLDAAGAVVLSATAVATGSFQPTDALPAGQYRVRSFNAAGYLNELYDNVPCTGDCTIGGALVTLSAGAVTTGIDFLLDPDTDADDDGIADTIDANKVTAADEHATPSSDFTDVGRGGTTSGTIAGRGGWTVTARDISPSGVQLSASGAGTAPAAFDICDTSGTERVLLDADTERANVTCSAAGTATVVAVRALPYLELRKPTTGAGTVVMIGTGQAASLGSPVVADPANTQPIVIRYVGDMGETLAVAILEPGESVDATVSPAGTIDVEVLTGAVEFARPDGTSEVVPAGSHEILEFVPLDNAGPVIRSVTATPDVLLLPNHKLVPVTIAIDAVDAVDPAPVCAIEGVSSNEPANGTGDGDTPVDWVLGSGLQLQLRAERSGNGRGRTYTIGVVCRDATGNVSRGAAHVTVPKGR